MTKFERKIRQCKNNGPKMYFSGFFGTSLFETLRIHWGTLEVYSGILWVLKSHEFWIYKGGCPVNPKSRSKTASPIAFLPKWPKTKISKRFFEVIRVRSYRIKPWKFEKYRNLPKWRAKDKKVAEVKTTFLGFCPSSGLERCPAP